MLQASSIPEKGWCEHGIADCSPRHSWDPCHCPQRSFCPSTLPTSTLWSCEAVEFRTPGSSRPGLILSRPLKAWNHRPLLATSSHQRQRQEHISRLQASTITPGVEGDGLGTGGDERKQALVTLHSDFGPSGFTPYVLNLADFGLAWPCRRAKCFKYHHSRCCDDAAGWHASSFARIGTARRSAQCWMMLEQSKALNTLVAQLAANNNDPLQDLGSSINSLSSKGAFGTRKASVRVGCPSWNVLHECPASDGQADATFSKPRGGDEHPEGQRHDCLTVLGAFWGLWQDPKSGLHHLADGFDPQPYAGGQQKMQRAFSLSAWNELRWCQCVTWIQKPL